MKSRIVKYVLLFLCFVCVFVTFAEEEASNKKATEGNIMISLVKFEVNDKHLELHYIIHNEGDSDIWLCTDVDVQLTDEDYMSHERWIGNKDHTLFIRRMYDVPLMNYLPGLPAAEYTRIGKGQKRQEKINIPIPIESRCLFVSEGKGASEVNCTSVSLKLGYYQENLPQKVVTLLSKKKVEGEESIHDHIGSLEDFSELNSEIVNKDDMVIIPYNNQFLKGEKSLDITINGVLIPYKRS